MSLPLTNRFEIFNRVDEDNNSITQDPPRQVTRQEIPLNITKQYFKIIQTTHHMEILNQAQQTGSLPQGMGRQVKKLTEFVKPACPNPIVYDKIRINTQVWMIETLKILIQHYNNTLADLKWNLGPFHPEAWDKATRWAKTRFRKKLTNNTLTQAKNIVIDQDRRSTATPQSPILNTQSLNDPRQSPPHISSPSAPQQPNLCPTMDERDAGSARDISPGLAPRVTPQPSLISQIEEERIPELEIHNPNLGDTDTTSDPPPQRHHPTRMDGNTTTTIQTQTDVALDLTSTQTQTSTPQLAELITLDELTPEDAFPAVTPNLSPIIPHAIQLTPLPQRTHPTETNTTRTTAPQPIQTLMIQHTTQTRPTPPHTTLDELTPEDAFPAVTPNLSPIIPRAIQLTPLPQRTHPAETYTTRTTAPQPIQTLMTQHTTQTRPTPSPTTLHPQTTLPQTTLQEPTHISRNLPTRVTRHPNTSNKKSWTLAVFKPTLILGDSNLSRIAPFDHQHIQIDSYPGATFLHLEDILNKTQIHCQVQTVIISLGINSKQQKPKETTVKQIQKAIKKAKETFPTANIYIPIINFSKTLPTPEITNLRLTNDYIKRNHQYIPPLPDRDFTTDRDHIHWTTETAHSILTHWISHLNLITP
ncbi:hypothetical protein ACEWY4_025576 [Coilia grayii]|uniref:SGNH hydrolase-type esterase domain-containing protein n=1 Tax=Coilia grayii TaxID=363190 RepID=A0ABD1ISG4_9TELE